MRHLAIGDIHGCFKALTTLAAFVPFRPDDVLITLGDYVNRGPDSCAVLDWLLWFSMEGQLVALRGNHEVMMLEARESHQAMQRWLECGGEATLSSYSPSNDRPGRLVDVPDNHWQFLEQQTRRYYETEKHFFVHANAYPDMPVAKSYGKMIEGKNPDCRCGLSLGPDGKVYAVIRVDNETKFGTGYLHHLTRFDPKTKKLEDLGVLAVKNPDFFDFGPRPDGKAPPWSHGYHKLPDGTLTLLHHHMAMIVGRDGTVYVTILYPFTLLKIDQFRTSAPSGKP